MIKPVSFITFKGQNKRTYYNNEHKIVEQYTDNNKLHSRNEYDEFERHIHTDWFDSLGNDAGFMHKKYLEDGFVETCKTPTQEYTRTVRNFVQNGFAYHTEKYISKTRPENNYSNEIVRDTFGKLVKMISNGKVIL